MNMNSVIGAAFMGATPAQRRRDRRPAIEPSEPIVESEVLADKPRTEPFTDDEICAIYAKGGITQKQLAFEVGKSRATVGRIIRAGA